MAHAQTHAEWQQEMAARAMALTRSELYLQLRYLNAALGALALVPAEDFAPPGTNGAQLCYDPAWVLQLYRRNRAYLPRAYLHSVLHCIFRHPWLRAGRDPALWGLACDIAVEQVLDTLGVPALTRPVGWLRQTTYRELSAACKLFSAGPIYRVLLGWDEAKLQKLQQEFFCDTHRLWPNDPDDPAAQAMGKQWEQLGRETQLSMQQAGRQASAADGARALQAQVQAAHSRRLYKDFLRRFTVLREEPHLDLDEFDLGYYTYGLRTYGNLPLIEPMETRESRKIHDFVIVLDTSESTSGELVRSFLRETFGLLRTDGRFFRRCRVAVLQCDDKVRDVAILTDLAALDRYAAQVTLTGGGGTDFRPAFEQINALCADGTLRDLRGVFYFTDGMGTYPIKPPPYEVAFLFLEDGTEPPAVPPWAMRLVLSEEEFTHTEPPAAPPLPL